MVSRRETDASDKSLMYERRKKRERDQKRRDEEEENASETEMCGREREARLYEEKGIRRRSPVIELTVKFSLHLF